MYHKLKYLYYLPVFAACLLASCDSDIPGSEDVDMGVELSFDTYQPTRAITTSFEKFAVFADKKLPAEDNTGLVLVFDNTVVSYRNGSWTYDGGAQHWFPNHEHSFVAVTPVSLLEGPSAAFQYSNSALSFTYTMPTTGGVVVNKDDVTDILAATHRRVYDSTGDGVITLKFTHLLSLIDNIALALNDDIMKKDEFVLIHKMEMSGIRTKADFSILPAAIAANNQTDDNVIEVTGQDGDAKLTIDFPQPKKLVNDGKHVNIFADNDALIMLPQVFAADSKTKIVFEYTVNGDPEATQKITLSFRNTKWEWGKSYVFQGSFAIDKAEIQKLEMGITDWFDEPLGSEAVSD